MTTSSRSGEKESFYVAGPCKIVFEVSPELFGRMEARATADQFSLHEWLLDTVIGELMRPETELVRKREIRAIHAAMLAKSLRTPAAERKPDAPHI